MGLPFFVFRLMKADRLPPVFFHQPEIRQNAAKTQVSSA